MKNEKGKAHAPNERSSGLHNDFSEQEETMTNSAMPPTFQLTASGAGTNPGNAKEGEATAPKKAAIQVEGVPEELVLILEHWEGIEYKSYPDNGHVSGGMGHLLGTTEEQEKYPIGTAIPKAVVEAWARKDVGEAWKAAQGQAAELGVSSHDFKVALGSMCFQNGVAWNTKHVKTWELMVAHKWEAAAQEAEISEWFVQTPDRVHEFQAALRKLADAQGGHLADPFRKKAAEAKELAAKKQSTAKPQVTANPAKTSSTAMPEGKEGTRQVQTKLKNLGFYDGAIDGVEFRRDKKESGTTKGIKAFQHSRGLPETGTVDTATWAALNKVETPSIWQQFMASLEKPQAEKANAPKTAGLAAPFTKLAAEAKKKAAGEECVDSGVTGTGNFMADSNFISQNEKTGPKNNRVLNPDRSMTNAGGAACRKVASEMLLKYLSAEKPEMLKELGLECFIKDNKSVADLSVKGNFLRILDEDKSHKSEVRGEKNESHPEWMVNDDQAQVAIAYIDSYLQRKIPVLVGVDHTYNRNLDTKVASKTGNGYNEGTTDHYITLSGIGKDEEGRKYYSFFDPGRDNAKGGAGSMTHNRLIHEGGTRFKAVSTGSNFAQTYHLAMVVVFPADRAKYAEDLKKNNSSWID